MRRNEIRGASPNFLHESAGAFLVPIHDRIGTHISKRLNGQRWIEAAHRWKCRAAEDEQIRNIPALAVAVSDRHLWSTAHARAALVARTGSSRAHGRPPASGSTHGSGQLFYVPPSGTDPS